MDNTATLWVALAVVQSYNPRRKVPRSDISIPDLECCLSKASFSAAQNSGRFLHTLAYSDIKIGQSDSFIFNYTLFSVLS